MDLSENGGEQVSVVVGCFLLDNGHKTFQAKATIDVLVGQRFELTALLSEYLGFIVCFYSLNLLN